MMVNEYVSIFEEERVESTSAAMRFCDNNPTLTLFLIALAGCAITLVSYGIFNNKTTIYNYIVKLLHEIV